MDQDKIRALAMLLGVDPVKLSVSLQDLDTEGGDPPGLEGFYFNPEVFRKLHSIDCEGLRKLVMPSIRHLRR